MTAKVVDAPNGELKDAFKLAVFLSLLAAASNIALSGVTRYYEPQTIPSGGWLLIIVGFFVYIIASFRLTMNILGIGFLRAFFVGFLTNIFWKMIAAGYHTMFK